MSFKGQVLLTLSEDREVRNIWTPPGGGVKVREGQTPREAAIKEVYEEIGITIDSQKLVIIGEPQLIYPIVGYDPYKGVGIIIFSYGYAGKWNPKQIILNMVPEKGCMIKKYALVSFPNHMGEIQKWSYKLYPNYALKLLEFVKMIREEKI